jgi:hypothetical protein
VTPTSRRNNFLDIQVSRIEGRRLKSAPLSLKAAKPRMRIAGSMLFMRRVAACSVVAQVPVAAADLRSTTATLKLEAARCRCRKQRAQSLIQGRG